MAELQMKNYEELRQKEDVMYDEIKTTKEKTEINHLAVKPRNQWLKHFLLILLISVFSAGVASAITYLTVCAKLQEKFNILDVKLAAIERQNGTEHRDNRLQKQINGSTAQLKQFTLDLIEKKLKDVERKSDMKDQEMEKRYNLTSSSLQKQINDSTDLAQLKQFTLDLIEKKLKDVERKSDMKDQEMEKRYNLTSSSLQKQINDSTDLAQLKQFKLDLIEKELKDVERKNQIKEQEMENRYNLTSSRLQKQINDSTDLVGFTAFGSGYDTRSPGYQLKFPVIKSSVGISNLSSMKKHGTFICEKKGLYQVTVTVTICSLHKSGFNIYKNNQLYMEYFIGSLDASFRNCDSGTGTAVVELHVNDALNVRNAHEDVDLFERLSSFSAVRLK